MYVQYSCSRRRSKKKIQDGIGYNLPEDYLDFLKICNGCSLIAIFYMQTDRTVYSNENTLDLFNRNFDLVEIERIQYGITMENKYIEQLVLMTPLIVKRGQPVSFFEDKNLVFFTISYLQKVNSNGSVRTRILT